MDIGAAILAQAKKIARRFRRPPEQYDDLVQEGALAMLEARGRYQQREAKLTTFLSYSGLGAMRDALRRSDTVSRALRRYLIRTEKATVSLQHELGREPTLGEIVGKLGMSLKDHLELTQPPYIPPLDAPQSPLDALLDIESQNALETAIGRLRRQQRRVLTMRLEGMQFEDIGGVLGLSKTRAFQIYTEAIERLRG